MSAEKSKPTGAFRAITLLILGMGILLCSLSFVLADFQFQRDLESRTKEVNSQNLNQALALEQNLNRSFAQADAILQLVKAEMETDGSLDTVHDSLLRDFLKPGIFNQIAVADSQGNLVYSAIPLTAPLNISDREHFQTHLNADSGNVYISAPVVNRTAGVTSIFLSRRLNDVNDNFAGIVSVGIAPDYFQKQIEQLQPETYNSFALLAVNGTFLTRFPSINSAEFMTRFKTHPVLAKVNQGVSFGIYESFGSVDGVARVGAFRRLSDYPAVVLVAISKNEAFRIVTERGSNYRHWAGAFSLLLSAIFLLLWWQVRKQYQTQEAQRRSSEIQEILHEIAEAAVTSPSLDELYAKVHQSVGRVLPAKNFYISFLDDTGSHFLTPYCVDETHTIPSRRLVGKGLTDYVMSQRRTVYVTPPELARLWESGEVLLRFGKYIKWVGAPLIDATGKAFGVVALFLITEAEQELQPDDAEVLSIIAAQISLAIERKRVETTLVEERNLLRTLIDNIPDRIFVKDRQSRFILNNTVHINVLGAHSQSEVLGKTDHSFRPAAYADRYLADDRKVMEADKTLYDIEEPTILPSGETGTLHVTKVPLHNEAGEVIGLIGISRDITERKRLEEELQCRATTDGLTGIFNRRYFLTRADEELQRIQRFDGTCSLLMLDIDHFKMVNDEFGHAAGDTTLQWITIRCREATRSMDLVGRIGGEEFAILLLETGISGAKRVAERLRRSIQDTAFRTEEGIQIPLRVSIGIAEHLSKTESLSELMARADKALYRAKNEGRNKVVEAE